MKQAYAPSDNSDAFVTGAFKTDQAIRRIGEGLLDHSLPKPEWTHAAHCAAAIYFMRERPELDLRRRMPLIIRSYNIATGAANTDTSGYHETITQLYLTVIAQFLTVVDKKMSLHMAVNFFMRSPFCKLDYLLLFYSRDRLFSTEARRRFIEPDLRAFPA